jgi:hypothetical protein
MANRPIQILGQGFGSTDAVISITANNNIVFSGPVPTLDTDLSPNTDITPVILCTFEIDQSFNGMLPVSFTVVSGTVVFTDVFCNYLDILINPNFTSEELDVLHDDNATIQQLFDVYTKGANPPLSQSQMDTLLDPAVPEDQKQSILALHNCRQIKLAGTDFFNQLPTWSRRTVNIDDKTLILPPNTLQTTISAGSTLSYSLVIQ